MSCRRDYLFTMKREREDDGVEKPPQPPVWWLQSKKTGSPLRVGQIVQKARWRASKSFINSPISSSKGTMPKAELFLLADGPSPLICGTTTTTPDQDPHGQVDAIVKAVKHGLGSTNLRECLHAAVAALGLAWAAICERPQSGMCGDHFDIFCSGLMPLWEGLVEKECQLLDCLLAMLSFICAHLDDTREINLHTEMVLHRVLGLGEDSAAAVLGLLMELLDRGDPGEWYHWLIPSHAKLFWDRNNKYIPVRLTSRRNKMQVLHLAVAAANKVGWPRFLALTKKGLGMPDYSKMGLTVQRALDAAGSAADGDEFWMEDLLLEMES